MSLDRTLAEGAARLGISLSEPALDRFATLLELLQRARERINLTAVRDAEGIVRRHFLESLALGAALQERGLLDPRTSLLDLGSGAGFPGLPLKLLQPEIELSLLEATAKKANFLRDVVTALQLEGCRVLGGRAETVARDTVLRASFDVVTARAVAELPALVELSLPFLRVGGMLAALKGSRWAEEVAAAQGALSLCGGEVVEAPALATTGDLRVVLIRKLRPTPERFPRHPGQPVAHPLRAGRQQA